MPDNVAPSPPSSDPGRRVEGPSFPPVVRTIATVLIASLASAGWRAADDLRAAQLPPAALAILGVAGLLIAAGWWGVMRSRTVIDHEGLCQRGLLWPKRVRHADITQLKLVQVPGLRWLIVPRLVVRTRGIGFASFPAGDRALLQAFRRLAYGADGPAATSAPAGGAERPRGDR